MLCYRAFKTARLHRSSVIYSATAGFLGQTTITIPVEMFDVELYTVDNHNTEAALRKIFNDNRLPNDRLNLY